MRVIVNVIFFVLGTCFVRPRYWKYLKARPKEQEEDVNELCRKGILGIISVLSCICIHQQMHVFWKQQKSILYLGNIIIFIIVIQFLFDFILLYKFNKENDMMYLIFQIGAIIGLCYSTLDSAIELCRSYETLKNVQLIIVTILMIWIIVLRVIHPNQTKQNRMQLLCIISLSYYINFCIISTLQPPIRYMEVEETAEGELIHTPVGYVIEIDKNFSIPESIRWRYPFADYQLIMVKQIKQLDGSVCVQLQYQVVEGFYNRYISNVVNYLNVSISDNEWEDNWYFSDTL